MLFLNKTYYSINLFYKYFYFLEANNDGITSKTKAVLNTLPWNVQDVVDYIEDPDVSNPIAYETTPLGISNFNMIQPPSVKLGNVIY